MLSPAAGIVIQAVAMPPIISRGARQIQSRGNYVVIAHGNSEYSLIPYLKAGSLKVRMAST